MPGLLEALSLAGADVVEVPVYRWMPPADLGPLDRLIDAVLAGCIDAVTFTSSPAAVSTLTRAAERGLRRKLVDALRGPCGGALRRTRDGPAPSYWLPCPAAVATNTRSRPA